ncbi:MAG: family 16 glycoside hydrolase [Prosthecobacter sp.]
MKRLLTFFFLATAAIAQEKADLSRWTESFDSEAAFDANWGAYGWHPDGKTSAKKEDRPLWWQIINGELQANTSPGVHPSGLTRRVAGADVKVSLRFKLPPKGLVGVGYNGMNRLLERNFHLSGIHITETMIKAWDEDILHPKGSPEAEKLKAEGKMNRKFIGAAKIAEMTIAAGVWHDLVLEMRGLDLRVMLDGKEALTYTTKAGDAEKQTLQLSVHSYEKQIVHGYFDDIRFEPLP